MRGTADFVVNVPSEDPSRFTSLVSVQLEYWGLGRKLGEWHFSRH